MLQAEKKKARCQINTRIDRKAREILFRRARQERRTIRAILEGMIYYHDSFVPVDAGRLNSPEK